MDGTTDFFPLLVRRWPESAFTLSWSGSEYFRVEFGVGGRGRGGVEASPVAENGGAHPPKLKEGGSGIA